jgi:hypothetical protein
MTNKEQAEPLVIDCEHFEPHVLRQLGQMARNFVHGSEVPWEAISWSQIWLFVADAMGGGGLDLVHVPDDALEFLNLEMIERATAEAEILRVRKDSGRCLLCGGEHEEEHAHEAAHVN